MFDVTGKVVIVTGGNKGIGEGIAKGFAKVGCKVSIWGRKEADNQRVRDEILAAGGECVAFQCDVTQEDQINAAVQGTLDAFNGRIDILVNNAGGYPKDLNFYQTIKTLSNALGNGLGSLKPLVLPALERAGIDPRARGETLSCADFARLSDALSGLLTEN